MDGKEDSKGDLEKRPFIDWDSSIGRTIQYIGILFGILLIVMSIWGLLSQIILFLLISLRVFESLGITNWRFFGIYYEVSEAGGSLYILYGYNLLALDSLFLSFLVTLSIWGIFHKQIMEKILDMTEKLIEKLEE
ncbi:MAG: hypothetical protein JSU57_02855 [Candidatus Heimdallarchaeota archaeon]|nr:MAG: hypothetical protein JSU57_02855 [Candidatus Heimdallarchaeota archaeon]